MKRITTLGEFIIQEQNKYPDSTGELSSLISSLRLSAKIVNAEINKAGLAEDLLGHSGNTNIQGEDQQKLDIYAHNLFIQSIEARQQVCGVASEEEDDFIAFESEACKMGKYVILMDPLDGSSNIDVNVSVGTIFSIYKRISTVGTKATLEDFLQCGRKQVAAGYFVYGSSTMMVYTTGYGVNGFTFDPTIGSFFLSHPNIRIPQAGAIYSINEGNYPHFEQNIKEYLAFAKGDDADSNRPYSARYIGSLVSDIHRNMLKGGIYLYPATTKKPSGKLRLLYECNPIAFLVEESGGLATDGVKNVLDIKPKELHQRCPFYAGSREMVERAMRG